MEKLKELFIKYKEVISYLFFGGCTFLVSMITFYLFNVALQMNEHVANILSWIIAVLFAYVTNRKYVFESKVNTKEGLIKEMLSFFGARLSTLAVEEVILYIGITMLHQNSMIIKLIAQVIVIVSNYFLSKLFIFKKGEK